MRYHRFCYRIVFTVYLMSYMSMLRPSRRSDCTTVLQVESLHGKLNELAIRSEEVFVQGMLSSH